FGPLAASILDMASISRNSIVTAKPSLSQPPNDPRVQSARPNIGMIRRAPMRRDRERKRRARRFLGVLHDSYGERQRESEIRLVESPAPGRLDAPDAVGQ